MRDLYTADALLRYTPGFISSNNLSRQMIALKEFICLGIVYLSVI